VPAVKDFPDWTNGFAFPQTLGKKLPDYETWGFAVFKLKPGAMMSIDGVFILAPGRK